MTEHKAYKWFIDRIVEIAKNEVLAGRVRSQGHAERPNESELPLSDDERDRKNLLLGLEPREREIVACMLEDARIGAVHDVACFLEEALSLNRIQLTAKEERISESPFATMQYDLVCRLRGDDWPDT